MKRFENLVNLIKDLPKDLTDVNLDLHPAIVELEAVFWDFYNCGYQFGDKSQYDKNIDFSNRLDNFYRYDEP